MNKTSIRFQNYCHQIVEIVRPLLSCPNPIFTIDEDVDYEQVVTERLAVLKSVMYAHNRRRAYAKLEKLALKNVKSQEAFILMTDMFTTRFRDVLASHELI